MTETACLNLPLLAAAQAQKHVTHNEALLRLDALVNCAAARRAASPPEIASEGLAALVASPGSAEFSGHEGEIAVFSGGAWVFFTPREGWRLWLAETQTMMVFTSGGWRSLAAGAGRNLLCNPGFRVNQRGLGDTVSLAAGRYGHDGLKAGASGASYSLAEVNGRLVLTLSAGTLVMPVEGELIRGSRCCLAHEGTALARMWPLTAGPSGSYAAAQRSAGGLSATVTAGQHLGVEFQAGTIVAPQFEAEAQATPYEDRPLATDRMMCERYFRLISFAAANAFQFSAYGTAGSWPTQPISLSPPMRTTPSAQLLGTWTMWNAANAGVSSASPSLGMLYYQTLAQGSGGMANPAQGGFQFSAEL